MPYVGKSMDRRRNARVAAAPSCKFCEISMHGVVEVVHARGESSHWMRMCSRRDGGTCEPQARAKESK